MSSLFKTDSAPFPQSDLTVSFPRKIRIGVLLEILFVDSANYIESSTFENFRRLNQGDLCAERGRGVEERRLRKKEGGLLETSRLTVFENGLQVGTGQTYRCDCELKSDLKQLEPMSWAGVNESMNEIGTCWDSGLIEKMLLRFFER